MGGGARDGVRDERRRKHFVAAALFSCLVYLLLFHYSLHHGCNSVSRRTFFLSSSYSYSLTSHSESWNSLLRTHWQSVRGKQEQGTEEASGSPVALSTGGMCARENVCVFVCVNTCKSQKDSK